MQEIDNRINKIEDNLFILHDKIEELETVINFQKTLIEDLNSRLISNNAFMTSMLGMKI